jgi:hypothetical protein|tara:strand:- start:340 stop:585 length:246 start_codon:yes stop_codon:yes gene_type:complete
VQTLPTTDPGEGAVKKGRHRRFEEARALKRNQDLDLESIFDSLSTDDAAETPEEGYSPAYEAWAEEADEESEAAEELDASA